jgi:hypothetical protein
MDRGVEIGAGKLTDGVSLNSGGLDGAVDLRLRCRFQRGNSRIHVLNDGLYERDRQRIIKMKQGSFQFGATPADSNDLVFKVHGR